MNAHAVTIRPATPAEHESAVELIADAFEHDPAVGVTAEARGLGVGRALVEATVDRARDHPTSWGVSLETENRDNAHRYARWHFDLLASVEVDPVTVYVMARPTRTTDEGAP